MTRATRYTIAQRPGRWALRVTVQTVDGEPLTSARWTWIGRLLRWCLPAPRVTVVRARELEMMRIDRRLI